jgi:lipoate synthase
MKNILSKYIVEACRSVYALLPDVLGITPYTKPEDAMLRIKQFFNSERIRPFAAHVIAAYILRKAAEMMARDGYNGHEQMVLRLMEVLDE